MFERLSEYFENIDAELDNDSKTMISEHFTTLDE